MLIGYILGLWGKSLDIQYAKAAVKVINSMDRVTKQRIRNAIEKIPLGDIKPLKGSNGSFRLRVGDWRIIFSYPVDGLILIEKIGSRGEIYKGV